MNLDKRRELLKSQFPLSNYKITRFVAKLKKEILKSRNPTAPGTIQVGISGYKRKISSNSVPTTAGIEFPKDDASVGSEYPDETVDMGNSDNISLKELGPTAPGTIQVGAAEETSDINRESVVVTPTRIPKKMRSLETGQPEGTIVLARSSTAPGIIQVGTSSNRVKNDNVGASTTSYVILKKTSVVDSTRLRRCILMKDINYCCCFCTLI